jgi:hypothetical protein
LLSNRGTPFGEIFYDVKFLFFHLAPRLNEEKKPISYSIII